MRRIILLGPQPEFESLNQALHRLGIDQPVGLITAGWEEDEAEDADLRHALNVPTVNLRLFERSEQIFSLDRELIQQLQKRQDELRHLRDAYRMRLDYALAAAREVLGRQSPLLDLEPERESAIEFVRILDRQYFVRTGQICHHYEKQLQPAKRPYVAKHRQEIKKILDKVGALVIAGGHAAIILNRLNLFDVCRMKRKLPLIAWSGGAMALADQIVFFHDSPPQGAGNAEVLRAGLGIIDRILPLPDANNRLQLDDPVRVSLFARRFSHMNSVLFDEHTIMDRVEGRWWFSEGTRKLGTAGVLEGAGT